MKARVIILIFGMNLLFLVRLGETLVNPIICGTKKCKELEKIAVDTGSTDTVISRQLAEEIGVLATGTMLVETAKGRMTVRTGTARITLEGRTRELPVMIHNTNVIGRTTLESMGFKVDPVAERLEPRPITT